MHDITSFPNQDKEGRHQFWKSKSLLCGCRLCLNGHLISDLYKKITFIIFPYSAASGEAIRCFG